MLDKVQRVLAQPRNSTCGAEADVAFCSRLGRTCGQVIAEDNCGTKRTVASCGTCAGGAVCGASNECGSQVLGNHSLRHFPSCSSSRTHPKWPHMDSMTRVVAWPGWVALRMVASSSAAYGGNS